MPRTRQVSTPADVFDRKGTGEIETPVFPCLRIADTESEAGAARDIKTPRRGGEGRQRVARRSLVMRYSLLVATDAVRYVCQSRPSYRSTAKRRVLEKG